MDGVTELARLLKERENVPYFGPQTGIIVTPPPELSVALGDKIILKKDRLIIAAHVLKDYKREFAIEGHIAFNDTDCGTTTPVNDGGMGASTHTHGIAEVHINTTYKADGKITYTDTLVAGDEVILIPSMDNQTYILVDKAVRL